MSKNVRVYCRFRPLNSRETDKVVRIDQDVVHITSDRGDSSFEFDHVFNEEATQEDVYEVAGKPLIEEIFKGYNATVFAYGQSGSGKTTTMTGYSHLIDNAELLARDDVILWKNPKDMGVVPRLVRDIFETIPTKKDYEFCIQLSYIEIYLEKIRDLLNPIKDNLEIRESKYKGLWIEEASEVYISSFEEAMKIMRRAELNRTVAATALNSHSSRSHSILIINLTQTNIRSQVKTTSKMIFVDLAGSEKVEKTKAEGLLLKQAQATNKSLLNLGLVIRALVEKKQHIPYRDTKLTRLLTDSLGGNSKTHLIVACSPSSIHVEETISSLRFGSITQQIKNKPRVNTEINIDEYKRLLQQLTEKTQTQQLIIEELQKARQEDSISQSSSYHDLAQEVESKTTQISELQSKLSEATLVREKLDQLQDDYRHSQETLDAKIIEYDTLFDTYEETKCNLNALQVRIEEIQTENRIRTEKMEKDKLHLEDNLKAKLIQLAEENQILRELSLREKPVENQPQPEGYHTLKEKYTSLVQIDENVKQLLEARVQHIKILEQSLKNNNGQMQEMVNTHKSAVIAYEKRIKDLESQLRILKSSASGNGNIVTPLRCSS